MRTLLTVLFLGLPFLLADSPDEKGAIAAVQKLFDAMAAHDSEAARAVVIPEGRLYSTRPDGKLSGGTLEEFAARLSTRKEPMLERMWKPTVLVRGGIAQVWAEYTTWMPSAFRFSKTCAWMQLRSASPWLWRYSRA